MPLNQTILLAVTGMSPAVLTETVWALAQERPPMVPDRVVVVTTLPGKARLEAELLQPVPERGQLSIWAALRAAVLALPTVSRTGADRGSEEDNRLILEEVRLIASHDNQLGRSFPLEDIRSPADNEMAADFILDEVRRITANPDTRLVASLAGGRKSMGALLYAALSLLGRPQDRLTHVLVSEPFEDPGLRPRFYFPTTPATPHHLVRTGAVYPGDQARIGLADVPFVRLRELFPQQLGRYPGSFNGLVRTYGERIRAVSGPPEVHLDDEALTMETQGVRVVMIPREYAVLRFLAERSQAGQPAYVQQKDAVDDFAEWLAGWTRRFGVMTRQRALGEDWAAPAEEDLRKQLSGLRAKIKAAGLGAWEDYLLPRRGAFGIRVRMVQ